MFRSIKAFLEVNQLTHVSRYADHVSVRVSRKNKRYETCALQLAQTLNRKYNLKLKGQQDKINGDVCQVSTYCKPRPNTCSCKTFLFL